MMLYEERTWLREHWVPTALVLFAGLVVVGLATGVITGSSAPPSDGAGARADAVAYAYARVYVATQRESWCQSYQSLSASGRMATAQGIMRANHDVAPMADARAASAIGLACDRRMAP